MPTNELEAYGWPLKKKKDEREKLGIMKMAKKSISAPVA
jgi:hypothetical protein